MCSLDKIGLDVFFFINLMMYSIFSSLLKPCTFCVMILMFSFLAERSVALGGNVGVFVTAARGVCGFGRSTVVLLFSSSVSCGSSCSDGSLLFIIVWSFCLFLSLLLFFSFCFVLFYFLLLLFFLSFLFPGCVCVPHCSGGLRLEVVVVVLPASVHLLEVK